MTKKDGDRLRQMSAELKQMALTYETKTPEPMSVESLSMVKIATAIDALLHGKTIKRVVL